MRVNGSVALCAGVMRDGDVALVALRAEDGLRRQHVRPAALQAARRRRAVEVHDEPALGRGAGHAAVPRHPLVGVGLHEVELDARDAPAPQLREQRVARRRERQRVPARPDHDPHVAPRARRRRAAASRPGPSPRRRARTPSPCAGEVDVGLLRVQAGRARAVGPPRPRDPARLGPRPVALRRGAREVVDEVGRDDRGEPADHRDAPRRAHELQPGLVVRPRDEQHVRDARPHLEPRAGLARADVALGEQRPRGARLQQRREGDRAGQGVAQQRRRVRRLVGAVEALQPRLGARRGERAALAGHAGARRAGQGRAVGEAVVGRRGARRARGCRAGGTTGRAGGRAAGAAAACRRACGSARTSSSGGSPSGVKPCGRQRVAVASPIVVVSTGSPRRRTTARSGASGPWKRIVAASRPSGDCIRQRFVFAATAGAGAAAHAASTASTAHDASAPRCDTSLLTTA